MGKNSKFSAGLESATGKIDFCLTNDVVLHLVVQKNNRILKGLVCSLMGLDPEKVESVELLNPIDYSTYDGKEIIMDIKVVLDDSQIVNVEMQVSLNKGREWWKNRSLLYLCRCYDNIGSGENYLAIKATTHISIVMQDLFENEEPEFYAKYRLLNVRTHKKYTGNFNLNVLYLKNLNMATENDEKIGLVYWAKAFLAKTWEDLKMIAENNEVFREVGESMFEVNAETIEREMAEAHRKYLETVATYRAEGYNEGYDEGKAYMQAELDAKSAELDASLTELNASRAENERLKEELQKYKQ